jgi:phospholipid/cholesterol/gamma-HCH transport system substrate-binding protein
MTLESKVFMIIILQKVKSKLNTYPQSSQRITTKVGLFVVIGIAILAASILTLGTMRKSFITRIDANATFVNVNELTKGNYVWFSGLKVGTVR